jgi:hypothetical protein
MRLHVRADWLLIFRFLIMAAVTYCVALVVVRGVAAVSGHAVPVTVPLADAGGPADALRLPAGVGLDDHVWVTAQIAEPSAVQSMLHAVTVVPTYLVVLAALLILLRLTRHARAGEPFTRRTVRLLRLLGATVLIGGIGADLVAEYAQRALTAPLVTGPVGDFVWTGWWLAGLGAMVVATVAERGVTMRTAHHHRTARADRTESGPHARSALPTTIRVDDAARGVTSWGRRPAAEEDAEADRAAVSTSGCGHYGEGWACRRDQLFPNASLMSLGELTSSIGRISRVRRTSSAPLLRARSIRVC